MMQETTTEKNDDEDGGGVSNVDSSSVGNQWHPDKSQTLQNFFSPPPYVEKIFETVTVNTPATIDLLEIDRQNDDLVKPFPQRLNEVKYRGSR